MNKVIIVSALSLSLLSTPVVAQTSSGDANSGLTTGTPTSTIKSGESGVNTHLVNTSRTKKALAVRAAPPGAVGSGVANQPSPTTPSIATQ